MFFLGKTNLKYLPIFAKHYFFFLCLAQDHNLERLIEKRWLFVASSHYFFHSLFFLRHFSPALFGATCYIVLLEFRPVAEYLSETDLNSPIFSITAKM